ncbi:acetolactate synthase [Rhodococcus sp. KBW08]|uniref:thiamine pyrophosphate-binding protein n=1 Tax=Rhodococcus sp. KBW08 TaxID=2144188 RepID=UPI000F59CB40|nr:thiamine pyrophosphate-binding protein [Rhodococcus sp. KBW08]RQO46024.1 acetolactate synthase [Rhodococcus sp. KBW08]
MKSYHVLAEALQKHGIDTLYGLTGNANMHYVAAFRDAGHRFVSAVHEGGAVGMADAHARLTGEVAVASVTYGPALTNTMTALTEATRFKTPLVLITGDTPPEPTYFQRVDIAAVAKAAGAGYERIYTPGSIVRDLNRAIRRSAAESRPIVLDAPVEILTSDAQPQAEVHRQRTAASTGVALDDLDGALGILVSAARPVLVAGRGAVQSDAAKQIVALAESCGAALATTALARELFAGHPRNIGIMGSLTRGPANDVLNESDCIVAFGAGLNSYTTYNGELTRGKRIVHIDTDAAVLDNYVPVDEGVIGDARDVAQALGTALRAAGIDSANQGWRTRVEARMATRNLEDEYVDRSTDTTLDIRTAARYLNIVLPKNRTLVSDIGRYVHGAWPYIEVATPGHFVCTGAFGSIGLGLAASIGAAVALPDQPVTLLVGDGGLMMNVGEISTAVSERLPIIVVCFNDRAYGAEHHLFAALGFDTTYTLTDYPDLKAVMTTMGVEAYDVSTIDDLEQIREHLQSPAGPVFLNVHLDPEVNVVEG